MISLQEAATHFEAVKWTTDGGFDCRCSVHRPDNHPSAHIKIGNKGLIGKSHISIHGEQRTFCFW